MTNKNPRVTDNDGGEISVTLDGRELRGWSYASDDERRGKMLAAREYVEGWCDGHGTPAVAATAPVAWRYRNRNSKHWIVTLDKPSDASPYVDHDAEIEPLYNAAPQTGRDAIIEECAKICDDVAARAYRLMEDPKAARKVLAAVANGSMECAENIRSSSVTRPDGERPAPDAPAPRTLPRLSGPER